jgi:hypothetical protein
MLPTRDDELVMRLLEDKLPVSAKVLELEA